MKTVIIGAGAMGCLFAHHFFQCGIPLQLLEKESRTVEKIKEEGILFIDGEIETVSRVNIGRDPHVLSGADIIYIFVKGHQMEGLLHSIKDNVKNTALLVSMQNGLSHPEMLSKTLPSIEPIFGTTSYGAAKESLNRVRAGGAGQCVIGAKHRESAERVKEHLTGGGFDVMITENPMEALWKKAIINAGINPLGAILGVTNGQIPANSHSALLQENLVNEAVTAASLEGFPFHKEEMIQAVRKVCERTASNRCSMLQDISAGRNTEIENINGHMVKTAKRHGIELPVNRTICSLIKALENREENSQ